MIDVLCRTNDSDLDCEYNTSRLGVPTYVATYKVLRLQREQKSTVCRDFLIHCGSQHSLHTYVLINVWFQYLLYISYNLISMILTSGFHCIQEKDLSTSTLVTEYKALSS